MNVQPSTAFTWTPIETGTTGLVGTAKVGIYDGDTAVAALTTTGVNEIVASGVYEADLTAPGTAGSYALVFSLDGTLDPDQLVTEELLVTTDAVPAVPGSNLYVTVAELRASTDIGGDWLDDQLAVICDASSRACEGYKNSRGFYPTTETRYYTADRYDQEIAIDDAVSISSVTVDLDGNGTYETTWVEGTDFYLDPPNAALVGQPVRRLVLRKQAGRRFPTYQRAIKVTGSFGWAETPSLVREAAMILARRLVKRKDTPLGILTVAGDIAAAARLGRIDPDVAFLLDQLPGARTVLFV